MASRISQVALEALVGGVPNARVTQVAVEALCRPTAPNARVTQVAVEALESFSSAPVAAAEILETQAALEWAGTNPPSLAVRETQAALEHVAFAVTGIWQTQACLEVLFPADGFGPVTARNYAYTGGWART